LKYVQEIHQLADDFIPQISKSEARKKKRCFWHFFGAATTEDVKILQDNIMNLQTATEISLRSFANIAENIVLSLICQMNISKIWEPL
jgi:hypothetical protein